jgi:hypothetical protein
VVTICTIRVNILKLCILSTQCIYVYLCGSHNKQRLFPYAALTGCWLSWRCIRDLRSLHFEEKYCLHVQSQIVSRAIKWQTESDSSCCFLVSVFKTIKQLITQRYELRHGSFLHMFACTDDATHHWSNISLSLSWYNTEQVSLAVTP